MALLSYAVFAALQASGPTLGDIRMHLFYQGSGRLSADVSPPADFAGWNTVIGEGSAEEPATDLLVVAELRASGEQNVTTPLRVTVQSGRRVLATRTFNGTLTSEAGRAYLPVWLRDVTCAGEIRVEVTFGRQRRSERLTLSCGE